MSTVGHIYSSGRNFTIMAWRNGLIVMEVKNVPSNLVSNVISGFTEVYDRFNIVLES